MSGGADEVRSDLATEIANEIIAERHRQTSIEGWTPGHDDEHDAGELADAAACYAAGERCMVTSQSLKRHMSIWPWDIKWWKPTNRRRDLVKAGALILAEIERIDRASSKRPTSPVPARATEEWEGK